MSLDRSLTRFPQPLIRAAGPAAVAFAALALAMPAARAQASAGATASITSEYSSRGMSLSGGHPAPQLRLDVDGSDGWYGGALLARVALADSAARLQVVAYGGYAHELAPGTSWEAGALDVSFAHGEQYRYHEFYAGLTRDRLTARLSYSPSYYGGGKTLYAELNGSYPLAERVSLTGHAGVLHPLGRADDETEDRLDLRLGVGVDFGDCNVQLALLASTPRPRGREVARALALSASYAF
jgi:uncharacterized protein (TIGR02001 family)